MRRSPFVRYVLPGLCALWLAAPLAAYTVYLKDGSKIEAREKYRVQGARALITLYNGTTTFIPVSQIDAKKTDELNRLDYGRAQVIPGGPQEVAPPPSDAPPERTLRDLVATREAGVRALPENRRPPVPGATAPQGKLASGVYDLMSWGRKPLTNVEMAGELRRLLNLQGIEEVEIHEGTKADRPFVEIITNSEGSVFKTLAGTAATLPLLRQSYDQVGALELLMLTTNRERAGQFTLTPQLAEDLLTKKVDLVSFFLRNVQY